MSHIVVRIIGEIVEVFLDASPYILLGLFAAGLLHAFCPPERIMRGLGPRTLGSVVKAALLGIPLPLCSCAVIPTAISIHRQGASKGATISFLISTPETGVDSIVLSFALLDPLISVFRPLAALITAIVAGVMQNVMGDGGKGAKEAPAHCDCRECCDERPVAGHGLAARLREAMRYGFGELLSDLALWLTLGLALAGVVGALVPRGFFEEHVGTGIVAMLAILGVSIPLYICATASTPLAAALIAKGLSPGAALVLLLAGPATNTATIIAVARFLGKRAAVVYLIAIGLVSIAMGLLLNWIYAAIGWEASGLTWKGGEIIPLPARVICAAALVGLLGRAIFRTWRERRHEGQ